MARTKKQISYLFTDIKDEMLEFFREWDKDDDQRAGDFIDVMYEKIAKQFQNLEKKFDKELEMRKKTEERLSEANYAISYTPLAKKSLRTMYTNRCFAMRQNPRKQTDIEIFRINADGESEWQYVDSFETSNQAIESLKSREEDGAIYLRLPKEKY